MKIPIEIKGMLERADEIFHELIDEYKQCIDDEAITERVKNLTYEILEKNRHTLDHSIREIWEKYYLPNLSDNDKKKKRFIYFPITNSIKKFNERLDRNKMKDLKQKNKPLYDYLLSIQPFPGNSNKWLGELTKIAGEGKHEHYKDLRREDYKHFTVASTLTGTRVSWAEKSVQFNPNNLNNVKIKILGTTMTLDTLAKKIIENPNISIEEKITKNLILTEYNHNVVFFGKIICDRTKNIVNNIFSLI